MSPRWGRQTASKRQVAKLVSVVVGLEGALDGEAEVLALLGAQGSELNVAVSKVETGDLLIENLGQYVDTNIELAGLGESDVLLAESLVLSLEEHDLGKDLVGKRAGHDEGGVAGCAAQVDETTLGKEDDMAAAGHEKAVDLGLDVLNAGGVLLQPSNVNLAVKVTNVANNGVVGHGREVLANNDVGAASGGHKDLTAGGSLLHGGDLVASHGSLEGVDRVNLGDDDTSTHAVEGHGAALADITKSGNNGDLASNHDIGSTLDTIDQGLAATVQVVELALGDAVVDVDGGNEELGVLEHAVEVVDTGGGLLRDTVAVLELLRVLVVNKVGQVTTIIKDEVELLAVLESTELLLQAPVVLVLGLTLPGKDGDTSCGNGCGGVVLSRKDVARRPGDLGTESSQGLDEDGSLNGHVQATGNAGTSERLVSGVLLANGHQTRHLILGQLNLLAAESSEGKVSDLELVGGSRHFVEAVKMEGCGVL